MGSLCCLSVNTQSQLFTPEQITKIENKLIGKHKLSLQWVSWETFGSVDILRDADGLSIEGIQELNGNFVSLFGKIKVIDEKVFLLQEKLSHVLIILITAMHVHDRVRMNSEQRENASIGVYNKWRTLVIL